MPLAIICAIGLPGCGKSYLCNKLNQIQGSDSQYRTGFIHICFDELQKLSSTTFLTDDTQLEQSDITLTPYKLFRYGVLRSVEIIIKHIRENLPVGLPDLLNTPDIQHYIISQIAEASSADNICILIDDNMYYQSMRYPYYKLARKYNIGYGQVFVNTPQDVCLTRNAMRHSDDRIDEYVVVRMNDRLEPPDPVVNKWEKHSIELRQHTDFTDLLSFIMSCLTDPELDVNVRDDSSREASMRITADDIVHQSDLNLRQLVKTYITTAKSAGTGSEDVKVIAVKANQCRKSLLSYVKSRSAELSDLLSDDAKERSSKDTQSELYQFLDVLFTKELSR